MTSGTRLSVRGESKGGESRLGRQLGQERKWAGHGKGKERREDSLGRLG
jgi:hypothetical protein